MKKTIILLSMTLLFISCGQKDNTIIGVDSAVSSVQNILNAQGCSAFYLTHPEVDVAISCEDGNLWVLKHDGSFTVGIDYNIADLLNHLYVAPVDSYVCSAEERIINGSFEEGHNLGNNQWNIFESIKGWSIDRSISDAPIEIQNGNSIGGIAASNGTAKLELDSHNKNGFSKSNAYVYQEIQTNKNKVYKVKFDYSARVNNNASTNRVAVYWNGKKIASLNNSQIGWESFELTVLGGDHSSAISFQAIGTEDTLGGYIDNVSVREVCL